MMSVPANWSELYFNLVAVLCVVEFAFLVWYEATGGEDRSDYIDIAARMLLLLGAIAASAAIQAFVALKVRDLIMMTWERYRELRFEAGREQGLEQGREQGLEQGRREGRHEGRQEGRLELATAIRGILEDPTHDEPERPASNGRMQIAEEAKLELIEDIRQFLREANSAEERRDRVERLERFLDSMMATESDPDQERSE